MTPTHPPEETAPDPPQDGVPPGQVVATTIDPMPGEAVDQEQQLTQPRDPVLNWVVPDSTEGVMPQLPVAPPTPGPNTTASALAPTEMDQTATAPPGFHQQPVVPIPSLTQVVPLGVDPDEGTLQAHIGDRSMADLTQSLAMTQAGGNPHAGAFSGIMEGLKEACGLMTKGFQQACLDVEVVVQKTLEDATEHNQAFTAKAAQDLDLWTAALWLVLDSDRVSDAEMETWQKHAQQTRQVVSDRILGHSWQVAKSHLVNGGPVRVALLQSFAWVKRQCVDTWDKVANWVLEILAQHVLVGQVGVFLAALYQLMCTQQQGITSMVVAQARVLVHLGLHSWATQALLTQLFAQVIPGLGSLTHLNPVAQPGSTWVSRQVAPLHPYTT